jgi:hypothetical protein
LFPEQTEIAGRGIVSESASKYSIVGGCPLLLIGDGQFLAVSRPQRPDPRGLLRPTSIDVKMRAMEEILTRLIGEIHKMIKDVVKIKSGYFKVVVLNRRRRSS